MFQNRQEDRNRSKQESLHACNQACFQGKYSEEARVRSEYRRVQDHQGLHELSKDSGKENAGREESGVGSGVGGSAWRFLAICE